MAAVSEEELDALYSAPLAEFIDARKVLATRAKKDGDKEGAARIAALPKPSAAAWAVNQMYRTAPRELEALHEAGASLRQAHRKGASGVRDVFTAQQAQRVAIEALLRVARTTLQKGGLAASDVTLDRVGETLTFISTLNRWGDAEPGRLSKELAPPGFDALLEVLGDGEEIPLPAKKKDPPKPAAKAPANSGPQRKAVAEARRKAEEALETASKNAALAEARAKETHRAADEAQKAANDTEANARHLADAVKAAEAALSRAKREASEAAKEASAAADHAETARSSADRARRSHDDAAEARRKAEAHLASAKKAEAALGKAG
ncbi:hypothetical protein LVJ94_01500 [Pendulispora rubella]|uniref:Uncharacterized protein n=1 Tax=Pendulispora rubella TaxID=2741070 RepID=A0ABZ2L8Q2_9BACT